MVESNAAFLLSDHEMSRKRGRPRSREARVASGSPTFSLKFLANGLSVMVESSGDSAVTSLLIKREYLCPILGKRFRMTLLSMMVKIKMMTLEIKSREPSWRRNFRCGPHCSFGSRPMRFAVKASVIIPSPTIVMNTARMCLPCILFIQINPS